jgi:hypothetical protein
MDIKQGQGITSGGPTANMAEPVEATGIVLELVKQQKIPAELGKALTTGNYVHEFEALEAEAQRQAAATNQQANMQIDPRTTVEKNEQTAQGLMAGNMQMGGQGPGIAQNGQEQARLAKIRELQGIAGQGASNMNGMAGGGIVSFQRGGLSEEEEDYFQQAVNQEGILDPEQLAFLEAIYSQESSSGANIQDSPSGARGPMQVMPGTYDEMADPDWDPNDLVSQTRAGLRYGQQAWEAADGDAQRAGQYYYGGPSALNNPNISDPNNEGFPTTGEYGNDIVKHIADSSDAGDSQQSIASQDRIRPGSPHQDVRDRRRNRYMDMDHTGGETLDAVGGYLDDSWGDTAEWIGENPIEAASIPLMAAAPVGAGIRGLGWLGAKYAPRIASLIKNLGQKTLPKDAGMFERAIRNLYSKRAPKFPIAGSRVYNLSPARIAGLGGAGLLGANALLSGDDETNPYEVAETEEFPFQEVTPETIAAGGEPGGLDGPEFDLSGAATPEQIDTDRANNRGILADLASNFNPNLRGLAEFGAGAAGKTSLANSLAGGAASRLQGQERREDMLQETAMQQNMIDAELKYRENVAYMNAMEDAQPQIYAEAQAMWAAWLEAEKEKQRAGIFHWLDNTEERDLEAMQLQKMREFIDEITARVGSTIRPGAAGAGGSSGEPIIDYTQIGT